MDTTRGVILDTAHILRLRDERGDDFEVPRKDDLVWKQLGSGPLTKLRIIEQRKPEMFSVEVLGEGGKNAGHRIAFLRMRDRVVDERRIKNATQWAYVDDMLEERVSKTQQLIKDMQSMMGDA